MSFIARRTIGKDHKSILHACVVLQGKKINARCYGPFIEMHVAFQRADSLLWGMTAVVADIDAFPFLASFAPCAQAHPPTEQGMARGWARQVWGQQLSGIADDCGYKAHGASRFFSNFGDSCGLCQRPV